MFELAVITFVCVAIIALYWVVTWWVDRLCDAMSDLSKSLGELAARRKRR